MVFERWLQRSGYAPHTIHLYHAIGYLIWSSVWAHKPLRWLKYAQRHSAESLHGRNRAAARAYRAWRLEFPKAGMGPPTKAGAWEPSPLPGDHVVWLLRTHIANDTGLSAPLRALYSVALDTGTSPMDWLTARLNAVQPPGIQHPDTGMMYSLSARTKALLDAMPDLPGPYLFPSARNGKARTKGATRVEWCKYRKQLPEALRLSWPQTKWAWARRMIAHGWPYRDVAHALNVSEECVRRRLR